jgi:hypothetical protein
MYTLDNSEETNAWYCGIYSYIHLFCFLVLRRDHGSVLTRPLKYIAVIFTYMIVPIYELLGPAHGHQCRVNIAHNRLPDLIDTMHNMRPWLALVLLRMVLKDRGSNLGQTVQVMIPGHEKEAITRRVGIGPCF